MVIRLLTFFRQEFFFRHKKSQKITLRNMSKTLKMNYAELSYFEKATGTQEF